MLRYRTNQPWEEKKNKDAKYAKSLEWLMVSLLFIISLSFTGNYGVNPYKDYIS
jgi:hypothetical protein